jgi:hypothetical protein
MILGQRLQGPLPMSGSATSLGPLGAEDQPNQWVLAGKRPVFAGSEDTSINFADTVCEIGQPR